MRRLLTWYEQHARQLPWRCREGITCPDPYATWVSEIMLQQTRVETVIPFFEKWMERFPTINDLASAPLDEVLSTWEGLGYYSRARNLQRAARIVVDEYKGELPQDAAALRRLPGIGRYTAGAIASIAFGQDEPALDGNIRRVLSRVFNVTLPARSPAGERRLWELAETNLPPGEAGKYNQALMDLGSIICTPRDPVCDHCPIAHDCQARLLGVQNERPVVIPKQKTPHYTVTAAVIMQQGKTLIAKRPLDGLLGGMWEFPGGKLDPGETLSECLQREICEELGVDIRVGEELGVYQHAYTHFRVTLHAFYCSLLNGDQPAPLEAIDLRWANPGQLAQFPMGKIDRQIAQEIKQQFPEQEI